MPRAEAGSHKALSNRMKSVGLQKLRWYCQMCQKQCRDENGFKCHTQTEGHLRQMKLFAENSRGIIDDFSRDFCRGFLDILSRRHSTSRVQANKVYQEYIAFKEHIHMNATMWTTLTEFCIYLGKEGKAIVDETEKGWYVQYIDRDPRLLARQMAVESQQKAELDDEERSRRMIQTQIKVAEQLKRERHKTEELSDYSATPSESKDLKVEISLGLGPDAKKRKVVNLSLDIFGADNNGKTLVEGAATGGLGPKSHSTSSASFTQQLRRDAEQSNVQILTDREKLDRHESWLHPGIVVRVMNKKLAEGRFYKLKGVVARVIDDFVGELKVDGALIRIDQTDLETVIPKVGSKVLLVNGVYRGMIASLLRIHEDKFNCDILLEDGQELLHIDYEDVCKIDCS